MFAQPRADACFATCVRTTGSLPFKRGRGLLLVSLLRTVQKTHSDKNQGAHGGKSVA